MLKHILLRLIQEFLIHEFVIVVYLGHKLSFIKKNETSPLTRGGLTNHIINNTKTNNQ